jgi:glycosyltransferase involved in cell wall biosynthesis
MTLTDVTLVVPFYRNGAMLARQIAEWELYPPGVQVLVVDDGSPDPARPIIEQHASASLRERLSLLRIKIDIPWNREEARNLGTLQARTDWVIHVDIDHVLPRASASALFEFQPKPRHWYRFPRWRNGKADETRRKDAIPDDCEFGRIHEHVDSYLIGADLYAEVGGYDLRFSGCLGGGSDFLKRLSAISPPQMMPDPVCLHVYTRGVVKDASDWCLSRDTTEGKRRARAKRLSGQPYKKCEVRSAWERVL